EVPGLRAEAGEVQNRSQKKQRQTTIHNRKSEVYIPLRKTRSINRTLRLRRRVLDECWLARGVVACWSCALRHVSARYSHGEYRALALSSLACQVAAKQLAKLLADGQTQS